MREADRGKLAAKLARLKAERPVAEQKSVAAPEEPAVEWALGDTLDELDEIDEGEIDSADADRYMDFLCGQLDILEIYDRYSGKRRRSRQHEANEIQVSCPIPGHVDKNPSASINLAKQAWVCYSCEEGGDALTIAGLNLSLDTRVPTEFMELRKRVLEDLGHDFITNARGFKEIVVPQWFSQRHERTKKPEIVADHTPQQEFFDLEEAVTEGELAREDPTLPDGLDFMDTMSELDEVSGRKETTSKALGALSEQVEKGLKKHPEAKKTPEKVEKTG